MNNTTGAFQRMRIIPFYFHGFRALSVRIPSDSLTTLHYVKRIFACETENRPTPVAARSAAVRLLGLRVRIPPSAWMSVSCECCLLSCRGLCDGPIPRPGGVRQSVCVSQSVIRCDNYPLQLQRVGRRGQTKKKRKINLAFIY